MAAHFVVAIFSKDSFRGLSLKNAKNLLITGSLIGVTNYLYYLSVKYIPAGIPVILLMQFT